MYHGMKPFGARLRAQRERKKLSVAEAAARIGVPVTTYREWEYGRAIKGEPYAAIANALELPLSELITGEKTEKQTIFKKFEHLESELMAIKADLLSFL